MNLIKHTFLGALLLGQSAISAYAVQVTTFFRPMNGATPVFLTLISGETVYQVFSADINVPADYR